MDPMSAAVHDTRATLTVANLAVLSCRSTGYGEIQVAYTGCRQHIMGGVTSLQLAARPEATLAAPDGGDSKHPS